MNCAVGLMVRVVLTERVFIIEYVIESCFMQGIIYEKNEFEKGIKKEKKEKSIKGLSSCHCCSGDVSVFVNKVQIS